MVKISFVQPFSKSLFTLKVCMLKLSNISASFNHVVCLYVCSRAVKLAEKLNSNFVLKYYQNVHYIRIYKAYFQLGGGGFSPEATRGRIE